MDQPSDAEKRSLNSKPGCLKVVDTFRQTGGSLQVPDNITLLHLPSYAPELNPVENVWEYLRANKLCGLVWDNYDQMVEACRMAWKFLTDDPDRIKSIGSRDWASVSG